MKSFFIKQKSECPMLPRMGDFLPWVALGFLKKKKYYVKKYKPGILLRESLKVKKEKYTLIFRLQKIIINHKPIISKFNGQA